MARALFRNWMYLKNPSGNWVQGFTFLLTDGGLEFPPATGEVSLLDGDSAAQVKAKVSTVIRNLAASSEFGVTVENNQIIWPDGTRT